MVMHLDFNVSSSAHDSGCMVNGMSNMIEFSHEYLHTHTLSNVIFL